MTSKRKKATLAIHGSDSLKGISGPVAEPVYQTTTFVFPNSEAVEGYMKRGEREHYIYARYGNPTQDILDKRLALLEGTEEAMFFASGMAAITSAVLSVLNNGDELITIPSLYGQTLNFFTKELPERYGIKATIVGIDELYDLKRYINKKTKLIYFETPTNPNLQVVDIAKVVEQAKKFGLKTMVDNTFATPVNQNPAEMGINYIVHSATKYLGGHSDVLAGAVAGPVDFVKKCGERMHLYGATLAPLAVYLMIRSLKTLEVRVHRQNKNAMKLAKYFKQHPKIEAVYYPGLPDDPYHEIAKKQMRDFGGMVCITVKGGKKEAKGLVDELNIAINATSLGGVETLVSIPVITSHSWQNDEELKAANVSQSMVRVSVGLEHPEDIIADFDRALSVI